MRVPLLMLFSNGSTEAGIEVSGAGGRVGVGLSTPKGAAPVMVGGPKFAPFSSNTVTGAAPAEEVLEDAPRDERLPWALPLQSASRTASK